MAKVTILITGGAGYIGSHTTLALLEKNTEVIVLDNLTNSSRIALDRVENITGCSTIFYQGDINDHSIIKEIFGKHKVSSVIHFAGLKSVGESVKKPLEYYHNNVTGTLTLLEEMRRAQVHNLIFSSSATVYGTPEAIPLTENSRTGGTTNPYGTSKFMVEQILRDVVKSSPEFAVTILRYFNPVGAHESGLIGEDPGGIPNNLMPFISQVASGKLPQLAIFGDDYPTVDGTGVRDYIHVMDLAEGHLKALEHIAPGLNTYNLGTGVGYSVFQMLKAFEKISGKSIPYTIMPRRDGDIAECWADTHLAEEKLGWKAKRGLEQMMRDTWSWQEKNPHGFKD